MSYYSKIILHMIFMLIFLLFASAGIITARFLKKRNPKWLNLHKFLMIFGISSAFAGVAWIVFVVQSEQGIHFHAPHTFFGLSTFILALTAPILGFIFTSKKTDKKLKPILRKIHKIIGWISLVLIVVSVFTGLLMHGIIYLPF